jgi:hypothetical protein
MTALAGAVLSVFLLDGAPKPNHFTVSATFTPPRRKAPGEVAVQFVASDPEVKINEVPAPRLKLNSGPATLAVPAGGAVPPRTGAGGAAGPGHYLDLTLPVTFPVTLAPGTPAGSHDATGTVTYFYCSKREGWCRKGTAEVAFPIAVP